MGNRTSLTLTRDAHFSDADQNSLGELDTSPVNPFWLVEKGGSAHRARPATSQPFIADVVGDVPSSRLPFPPRESAADETDVAPCWQLMVELEARDELLPLAGFWPSSSLRTLLFAQFAGG